MNEIQQDMSYSEIKQGIAEDINKIAERFVSIGYKLKIVRNNGLYLEDGYKDIYEFAQKEYNLKTTSVKQFIAINERFSVDGDSQTLIEDYRGYGSSKLSEMLSMTEQECEELINAHATREDIREVKKVLKENKQVINEQEVKINDEISILPSKREQEVKKNYEEEVETKSQPADQTENVENTQNEHDSKARKTEQRMEQHYSNTLTSKDELTLEENAIQAVFELPKMKNSFNELCEVYRTKGLTEDTAAEIIAPSLYNVVKKGIYTMFFLEQEKGIKIMKIGNPNILKITYMQFIEYFTKLYDPMEKASWSKYYKEIQQKQVDKQEPKEEMKKEIEEKSTEVLKGQVNIEDYNLEKEIIGDKKEDKKSVVTKELQERAEKGSRLAQSALQKLVEEKEQEKCICETFGSVALLENENVRITIDEIARELLAYIKVEGKVKVIRTQINYCPICGKKL